MPYIIRKRDDQYCVYKRGDDGEPEGDTLGCHATREEAQRQIAAIWASENAGKGWITPEQMEAICPSCAQHMRDLGFKAVNLAALKQMPEHLLKALCERAGDDPGFWTRCASMSWGEIDDTESFCAWLHHECTGKWPGEKSIQPESVKAGRRLRSEKVEHLRNVRQRAAEVAAGIDEVLTWAEYADQQDTTDNVAEIVSMRSLAVKSLGDGRVGGYAAIFGDPDHPDLSDTRDFFTKKTDFWLDRWPRRPMIYHHAQDPATADEPVVGTWDKAFTDDIGLWVEGQLDMAHRYREAILKLIEAGALALSTDSAPHLVKRRRAAKGTHEIVRWPVLAVSLTPTPAEPRLRPVAEIKAAYAAAGLDLPPELDRADAGASGPGARERAAALKVLLEIETSED